MKKIKLKVKYYLINKYCNLNKNFTQLYTRLYIILYTSLYSKNNQYIQTGLRLVVK